jgi:hypothetical protein
MKKFPHQPSQKFLKFNSRNVPIMFSDGRICHPPDVLDRHCCRRVIRPTPPAIPVVDILDSDTQPIRDFDRTYSTAHRTKQRLSPLFKAGKKSRAIRIADTTQQNLPTEAKFQVGIAGFDDGAHFKKRIFQIARNSSSEASNSSIIPKKVSLSPDNAATKLPGN